MSKNNHKNNGNFTMGIVITTIGVIALFATFGYVKIVWPVIWKLWPILLILVAICLLPINKYVKGIILMLIILGSCFIYQNKIKKGEGWNIGIRSFYEYIDNEEDIIHSNSGDAGNIYVQEFSEPYQKVVNTAKVDIEYAAGVLRLEEQTSDLVKATNESKTIRQEFRVKYNGDNADIDFETSDDIKIKKRDAASNRFHIALNEHPVWEFEIDVGACDLNFDFTPYKVSKIELDGGACDIEMKIGNLQKNTEIDLETGVSDIKIGIPEEAACRIKSESILSNKDFNGFVKMGKGIYETSNYMEASQVVEISLSCAISDVTVYRY